MRRFAFEECVQEMLTAHAKVGARRHGAITGRDHVPEHNCRC